MLVRDVGIKTGSGSFTVAHLAKDSAILTCDCLNCLVGVVGVVADDIGRIAVKVTILGSDLAIGLQLFLVLWFNDESAFTMGNGNSIDLTRLHVLQPWRLHGSDSCNY